MSAIALVVVATIAAAVLLAVLLPGAGLVGAIVVAVIGLATVLWLTLVGASGRAPSEVAGRVEETEFLGPGGPDDPGPRSA